jgi:hypothetical protein
LVVCIAPWSNLPINDDWLYAHIARNLAENGHLSIDVPVASSVVGQALIAWPVIHFFGFSFLALRRQNAWLGVVAAAIAGFSFWIRQLSALVLPALLIAEIIADRPQSLRAFLSRRGTAIGVWTVSVSCYFWWSTTTGNVTRQSSDALARILSPDPLILFAELGIFGFYMTFFSFRF